MSGAETAALVMTALGTTATVASAMKKPPKPKEPERMIDPNAVADAGRKAAAEAQMRGGRASTILTDNRLGG